VAAWTMARKETLGSDEKGSVEGWRDLSVMIISKPSHRLWCISCGGWSVVEQLEVIRLLLGNSRVIKISESQGR
jgi:hypothetical protein